MWIEESFAQARCILSGESGDCDIQRFVWDGMVHGLDRCDQDQSDAEQLPACHADLNDA
jgi:hypothetical protein